MQTTDILEMLMLVCFSTGWYWSIGSMIVTGKPYGKSTIFVLCTISGYVLGLTSKLWAWQATQEISYLLIVYCWNLTIASIDLMLLCRLSQGNRVSAQNVHFIRPTVPSRHLNADRLIHSGLSLPQHVSAATIRLERL